MMIDLTGMKLVVESSHHICPFHEKNPGASYAGCTCSGSYSGRYIPDPNPPQICTKCNGAGVTREKE